MAFDPISLALSKGYTKETAEGMGAVQGKPGPAGPPGTDGFSPTVEVAEISGGHEVTITDINGPKTFDVMDGRDGAGGSEGGGAQGPPGENGVTFTPAVSEDGVISWTNDGGLPNPEPVNIKGPPGPGGGGDGTTVVNWEDINGRPDLSAVSSMKVQPATLLPEMWFNNRQTISVPDVLADEAQQLIVPVPAQASKAAYLASGIKGIAQAAGGLTFQCSTVPTESISLNIYILGAAEIKQEAAGKFVWWSPQMTGPEAPEPYKASASSSYENNLAPYKAFDGQPATDGYGKGGMWSSADHPKAAYIQFDFGRRMFIKGLRINPAYSIYGLNTPKWFYVSGSDDGTNWNEIAAYSNVEWASMGEYSEFVLEEPVIYRFYRIGASNVQSSDSFNGRVGYGDIQFSIPEAYDVNS